MAKHSPETRLRSFLIPHLRRASKRWPALGECAKLARVDRGKYKCAMCEAIVGSKDYVIDHIDCVVPPEIGFTSYDEYIKRLFCDVEGLQCLCHSCHDIKSSQERELRTVFRRAKKEQNSEE